MKIASGSFPRGVAVLASNGRLQRAAIGPIKKSKQGSLHSALKIPSSQKIPVSTINQRLAGNPSEAMRKKLQFAKNARSWGK
jgi:hypothetical protein